LEEGALQIRTYLEELEYSPEKLAQSEKRLHLLQDLCKKYGATLEDVLAYAEKATVELDKWLSGSKRLQSVTEELTKKFEEYRLKAELLSSQRKKQGQLLETKVTAQLAELAMPYVRFSINLFPCTPTVQGLDQVNFLISPNPGEPLMPVAKIASGGELSRIMLALKTILAEIDGIGTLVFDEIDSGIGGKTAQKVADKLEKISKSQQVICVTHSPLIAALADQHLILEKEVKQGRTRTIVRELKEKERVEELARMLGGENPSSDLKKHASLILKSKIKEG
jgi:DNA repair protein RecN (Recombination protein N)